MLFGFLLCEVGPPLNRRVPAHPIEDEIVMWGVWGSGSVEFYVMCLRQSLNSFWGVAGHIVLWGRPMP